MFGQNAFRNMDLAIFAAADAQFLQLDVGDAALAAPILGLVGLLEAEFTPD